jgi:regulator of sirC expression with transglutaminase-like and TPR domain
MTDQRERFRELLSGGDDDFDLAEAALLIATEHDPTLDVSSYLTRLDQMASEAQVFLPVGGSTADALGGLNRYLFDHFGLVGNQVEYYDPRNSFLNDVLDRRMGIPITVSVVYLEVGWRLRLALFGIGMPGHFLIGCRDAESTIILDAFNGGRTCSMEECAEMIARIYGGALPFHPDMLRPVARRDIVIRMLGNLRGIAGQQRRHGESLRWSDLNVIASQGSARSLRERGAVRLATGDRAAAREDLIAAIKRADSDDERRESEMLLHHLDASEQRREA